MLYTLKEVAQELKLSLSTIKHWRMKGLIKVVKINGSIRVSEEELKRLKGGF